MEEQTSYFADNIDTHIIAFYTWLNPISLERFWTI